MSLTANSAVRRPLTRALLALGLAAALLLRAGPAVAASLPGGTAVEDGEWPLRPRPRVIEGFDPPLDPWGAGHRGVDLAGSLGQRVHAARAGTVTFAGVIAGRGVVVVDHGATRTTYQPVDASVRVGDTVAAGDRLGTLRLFGSHCFPRTCLHWGLLEGETYLDPLTLVGGGPVRLLPFLADLPTVPDNMPTGPVPQLPRWRPLGSGQLFRP